VGEGQRRDMDGQMKASFLKVPAYNELAAVAKAFSFFSGAANLFVPRTFFTLTAACFPIYEFVWQITRRRRRFLSLLGEMKTLPNFFVCLWSRLDAGRGENNNSSSGGSSAFRGAVICILMSSCASINQDQTTTNV
jgi:hypothetical protein